jgi:YHS domain-containing protein
MLIRFSIFFILLYVIYKIIKTIRQEKPFAVQSNQYKTTTALGEELVEDPYCHTYIPISQACRKEIAGKEHYFCSKECSEEYIRKNK